jgi:hypothetical protein
MYYVKTTIGKDCYAGVVFNELGSRINNAHSRSASCRCCDLGWSTDALTDERTPTVTAGGYEGRPREPTAVTRDDGVSVIRPGTMDAVKVCKRECQELLWTGWQRDDERDRADPPRRHAVCPDVLPQYRTRWRHFRLKHFCSLYLQSIESPDLMPKELRRQGRTA